MTIARFDHALHTLFVIVLLLFSLGACSGGTSPTTVQSQSPVPATRQPSPTATPLPAGTILYQADWSRGLASWQGTHGWKVVQGQLESNSSGSATFTVPYRPTVSDYAVEVRIQVVRSMPPYGGYFLISTPKSPGKDGYHAGVLDLKGSGPRPFGQHPQSHAYIEPTGDMSPGSGIPQDYEPGSGWHTYRIEVQGNEVSLLDDGVQIGSASSQQTDVLSNGPIAFSSELVILRVSSLRILTL
ncbi:MAG TPA: family 16 glycoside hydrolase [Ktedonobacteraceae bacterium]